MSDEWAAEVEKKAAGDIRLEVEKLGKAVDGVREGIASLQGRLQLVLMEPNPEPSGPDTDTQEDTPGSELGQQLQSLRHTVELSGYLLKSMSARLDL